MHNPIRIPIHHQVVGPVINKDVALPATATFAGVPPPFHGRVEDHIHVILLHHLGFIGHAQALYLPYECPQVVTGTPHEIFIDLDQIRVGRFGNGSLQIKDIYLLNLGPYNEGGEKLLSPLGGQSCIEGSELRIDKRPHRIVYNGIE